MDLRTPLLRACFCNRFIHTLSLDQGQAWLFLWLGVLPWSHWAKPVRRPTPQYGPVTFSAKHLHLSLCPAPSRWLCRPKGLPRAELRQGANRCAPGVGRFKRVRDHLGPRPPSIPAPPPTPLLTSPPPLVPRRSLQEFEP